MKQHQLRIMLRHLAPAHLATIILVLCCSQPTAGQIVINEIVKEERTAGSGSVSPDTREFIELYNAGAEPVDLTGWSIGFVELATGANLFTDTIPSGTIAPGGYYVIGGAAVPNVDFSPVPTDLYPDGVDNLVELRNPANELRDAIAYEVFRNGTSLLTTEQLAEVGSGYQGQVISMNANAPNGIISWARYRDGVDSNRNGLDFGMLPVTPGTSNNLPQNQSHAVPDVDALSPGTQLPSQYVGAFTLPRVIDPTVASSINPRAIPASPSGGNAIVAWDESGGGNTVYSKELVNSFDLYAYFDTTPLGVSVDTNDEEWETIAYGIGSSDPFFTNPDPSGGIFVDGFTTQNASTGIGWMYQQYEIPDDPATPEINEFDELSFSRLMLIDFGDGGNSTPEAGEWNVIETIDMSGVASGWYRLAMDYDPATGEVTAVFGEDSYTFTVDTDLAATFFVGHREAITAQGSRFDKLNPPIYDLFVQEASPNGDFNGDGFVNIADYTIWRDSLGATGLAPFELGDGDGDGNVTTADYDVWKTQFGQAIPAAIASAAAVPEPSAFILVLGTVLVCGARLRRA